MWSAYPRHWHLGGWCIKPTEGDVSLRRVSLAWTCGRSVLVLRWPTDALSSPENELITYQVWKTRAKTSPPISWEPKTNYQNVEKETGPQTGNLISVVQIKNTRKKEGRGTEGRKHRCQIKRKIRQKRDESDNEEDNLEYYCIISCEVYSKS